MFIPKHLYTYTIYRVLLCVRHGKEVQNMMNSEELECVNTALAWLQDARESERKGWWQMAVSNLNEVLMMQEDCE